MKVHVDGARFANAVAALGCAPADIAWRAGVDVLSLRRHQERPAVRRGDRVLRSRARRGIRPPAHAGRAARVEDALSRGAVGRRAGERRVAARMPRTPTRWRGGSPRPSSGVPGARLLAPVEANGVFVDVPPPVIAGLRARGWQFYEFVGATGMPLHVRVGYDAERGRRFVADMRELAGSGCRDRRCRERGRQQTHAFRPTAGHCHELRRTLIAALAAPGRWPRSPITAGANTTRPRCSSSPGPSRKRATSIRTATSSSRRRQDVDRRAGAAVADGEPRPDEGHAEGRRARPRSRATRTRASPRRCAPSASPSPARPSNCDDARRSTRSKAPASALRCASRCGPIRRWRRPHRRRSALVFGSIVVVDLRLLGLSRGVSAAKLARLRAAVDASARSCSSMLHGPADVHRARRGLPRPTACSCSRWD